MSKCSEGKKSEKGFCNRLRDSKRSVLVIVFIALLLDNLLLTVIVPIVPNFLWSTEFVHFNYTLNCIESSENSTSRADLSKWISRTQPLKLKPESVRSHLFARVPILTQDDFYETQMPIDESEIVKSCVAKEKEWRHRRLTDLNVAVGVLFASKAIMQSVFNPVIGVITNRVGYTVPMLVGILIMLASTLTFAFGTTYPALFIARAIQGIGSSCSSVAGLGLLASKYTDDEERGQAMGVALGGLAFGVMGGPPFGGIMYESFGKESAFLCLSALAVFEGFLELVILRPSIRPEPQKGPSLTRLLRDPYILLAAGSITFGNMGIAMLEPSLPVWMKDTMRAQKWEQGVAFLPCSLSYLIGANLFGYLAYKMGRWFSAGLGMVVMGISVSLIPLSRSLYGLIIPNACLGLSIGMVDCSMMPIMGYLVDLRHVSVYGGVYAIADIAFCFSFALGPILSGTFVRLVGFEWTLRGIGILAICYCPLLYLLRNPPARNQETIDTNLLSPEAEKQASYGTQDNITYDLSAE